LDHCHNCIHRRVTRTALGFFGMCTVAVVLASPSDADDGKFLADLKQPGMVHPAMSDQDLLIEGRQVCFEVGKVGISPDAAKAWVVKDLDFRGLPSDYATAGMLVHFALHDLGPNVPNSSGI
jgi:hypothetical protein